MADRERYSQSQFIDVDYDDFIADPLRTVNDIYDYFGLALTAEAHEAMVALHTASTADDRQPSHRYDLSDFGLTLEEVNERFSRYRSAYLA